MASKLESECLKSLIKKGFKAEEYVTNSGKKRSIVRAVPILVGNLKPNPWNPNSMNVRQGEALRESLDEFGQVLEVVVRPHPKEAGCFQIVDGEHRFKSLDQPVSANVLFGLSDTDAKKLTVVLNETRGRAEPDKLKGLLGEMSKYMDEDDLLYTLPYTKEQLAAIMEGMQLEDSEGEGDGAGGGKGSGEESWETIYVRVSASQKDVIQQAYDLVSDSVDGLPKDAAIAWGRVFELIAADFIGG